MRLMERIRNIWMLLRGGNLLFTAMVVWCMEKWVATPLLNRALFGEQLPWYVLALLMLATVFVAAGGYVVNDYFDVKIDSINRPDRLVVTRGISKQAAMRLSIALSGAGALLGMVVAWMTHSWLLALIYVIVPGLLWFYSSSYKRILLLGNLTIAVISGLVPLLVAIANIDWLVHRYGEDIIAYTTLRHDLFVWLGGFALFAFLGTWIREIIKDMQDEPGDRELECHTMPVVWGNQITKVIVSALMLTLILGILYVAYYLVPFPHDWLAVRYPILGLLIPIVCTAILMWRGTIPSDYRSAQNVMKFVLFMGVLYSYEINRQLCILS